MSILKTYSTKTDYSYAPGIFPSLECLLNRPNEVRRVLIHSDAQDSEGVSKLLHLSAKCNVRVEIADAVLRRLSGKENCYSAAVFTKFQDKLCKASAHMVLVNPSDQGNLGAILRSCLGFNIRNIAIIRPCADVFDPKVVRASMGAVFSVRLHVYDGFELYRSEFPGHHLYPFMTDAETTLEEAVIVEPYALIFGNESRGLPPDYHQMGQSIQIPHSMHIDSLNLACAATLGAYFFMRKGRE